MKSNNSRITGLALGALGIGTFVFSSNLAKIMSGIIYDSRCSGIDNNTIGQIKEALWGVSCHLADVEKVFFVIGIILIVYAVIKVIQKD